MKKLFTVFISLMLILNFGNLSAQTEKTMPPKAKETLGSKNLKPMADAENIKGLSNSVYSNTVDYTLTDPYIGSYSNNNVSKPINYSKGNMIFGYRSGWATPEGHITFDVDNPTSSTAHSSFTADILGGEYYDGYYYASENGTGFNLYKVDHNTGTATVLAGQSTYYNDLTYNYADGVMYAFKNPGTVYTINLSTGAATQLTTITGTPTNGFITVCCDLSGNMYGIELTDATTNAGLYSIDVAAGTCSLIGSTGLIARYAQGMTFDHSTGILYWCQYGGSGASNFCTVNTTTGAATSLGTGIGEIGGVYFPYVANQSIAAAPTNFTVTPVGTTLVANLAWTNPSTTVSGTALSSITKIVIERNGAMVHEITSGTGVGAAMTWTDNSVPSSGNYNYTVHAVTSEGNGQKAAASAVIGDMCNINFEMFDDWGDGWNGSTITVSVDGTTYGTVTLGDGAYGTQSVLIPAGDVSFTWSSGSDWDYEIWFTITDSWDIEIYSCELGDAPSNGVFHTYTNTCTAPETATITGTITKNTGGAAIEGASVAYTGGPVPSTVQTTASGNYSIDAIVGYSYNVTISANGYNTITETYTPVSGGATKNYQMTAPSISVAPTEVDETTSYMVDAHATVTITNNGDGPLTWSFVPEYQDKAEETVSYMLMDQDIYSAPLNDINNATYIGSGSSFPGFMGVGDYYEGVWYLSNVEAAGIYKVDPTNGAISQVCVPSIIVNGMCAYAGEMYVINSASQTIYTLNLTTGATTQVCAVTGMFAGGLVSGMAIDNSGRCFVLVLNDETIYEVNLSTGVATPAVIATFNANYGQDIAIDREDNQVYWAAFNYTTSRGEMYKVNVDEGTLTLLGYSSAQLNALAIPTTSGWLSAEPASGEIAAGATQTVEFTMDGSWAEEGTFYADAIFKSSNPNVGEAVVDVTFTIAPPDCEAPTNLVANVEDYNDIHLSWTAPDGGKGGSKEVLLSENFETNGFPTGWVRLDSDGDGYGWENTDGTLAGYNSLSTANSASYINYMGPLYPNNWMITPQINLGSGGTVEYWVSAQDQLYAYEHYGVYISTTGTNPTDFTLLFEETMVAKGTTPNPKENVRGQGKEVLNWYNRSIDLSAYSGNVYIAWRHFDCTDAFSLNVDEIVISSGSVAPPPEGLIHYNIYRGNDMTPFATVGPTVTSYVDENVSPAGSYCYKVRAEYEDGCISLSTNEACADVTVKKRTVSGTVKNSLTSANIAGASVRFDAANTTETLANGSYTIDVPLGTYSVVFSAEGYVSYTETGFVVDDDKTLNVTLDPTDCSPVTDVAGVHSSSTDRVTLSWTPSGKGSKAAWDRVDYFTTNASGEQGVATDGNYIYTAFWNTAGQFGKYQMDGTFIETFTISGASGIRDLTYDGTYFYGGGGSTTMNVLDFENKVLVSNITTPLNVRHCTYDPNYDEFWVGDWATLARVSKQGSIQANGPTVSSVYGSGYDNVTDGGPYLLLFSQDVDPGNTCQIVVYQYKIGNNSYNTTPVAVLNDLPGLTYVPGAQGNSIAGGAYVAEYNGKVCFFGNVQQSPNVIGIYELGEVPAVIRYDIYREGSLIGTADPTESEYIDNVASLANGTYEYCVVAVCEEGFESDEECTDVIINKIGIDSYSNIKLYPNPANTVVNIEGENIITINVYNSIGQHVAKYENTNVINVSSYSNGVYFINITTINGTVERHKVVVAH